MLERAKYIGCTILNRSYKDVVRMTYGELCSQYALHLYYNGKANLKGTVTLGDIFI